MIVLIVAGQVQRTPKHSPESRNKDIVKFYSIMVCIWWYHQQTHDFTKRENERLKYQMHVVC